MLQTEILVAAEAPSAPLKESVTSLDIICSRTFSWPENQTAAALEAKPSLVLAPPSQWPFLRLTWCRKHLAHFDSQSLKSLPTCEDHLMHLVGKQHVSSSTEDPTLNLMAILAPAIWAGSLGVAHQLFLSETWIW
ncbi:hypothetical protein mRhiFer1_008743 [Rhinolophus ferrumequinum]|uniref:Uncharacterized protein n=1 Tax=Rhinolophus ferrumequinum TaxID=59479 RepID=A0A7J7TM01_RHIFE|nr:hypothetical protein mRhiFer1_008743 [Rhinolophus ferrumequinum]